MVRAMALSFLGKSLNAQMHDFEHQCHLQSHDDANSSIQVTF